MHAAHQLSISKQQKVLAMLLITPSIIVRYANGDVYAGDWHDDSRHGCGTFTSTKTGYSYYGMWKGGMKHGSGALMLPCGAKVTGQVLNPHNANCNANRNMHVLY